MSFRPREFYQAYPSTEIVTTTKTENDTNILLKSYNQIVDVTPISGEYQLNIQYDKTNTIVVSGGVDEFEGRVNELVDSSNVTITSLYNQYTAYDSNDYQTTTNSLLNFAGYQTWCCRVRTNKTTDVQTIIDNSDAGITNGLNIIFHGNGNIYLQVGVGATNREANFTGGFTTNTWYNIVAVASATELAFWVNGTKCQNPLVIDANVDLPVQDFNVGVHKINNTQYLDGDVSDVEIYSGATTNPENWTPGVTTSLASVSLVFQSINGSGDDNEQGVVFTTVGDPTISTGTTFLSHRLEFINNLSTQELAVMPYYGSESNVSVTTAQIGGPGETFTIPLSGDSILRVYQDDIDITDSVTIDKNDTDISITNSATTDIIGTNPIEVVEWRNI